MRARFALVLACIAGAPGVVAAQEVMRVTYSWQEVVGLTTNPVASPNSVLDAGEGARININLFALRDGMNAIGQTLTVTSPPPGGEATIRGITLMSYNLRGEGGGPAAAGTWGARSFSSPFAVTSATGTPALAGALLENVIGQQFIAPGGSLSGTNPINNAFRGVWQPTSFTPRAVFFIAEPSTFAQPGQQNSWVHEYWVPAPEPLYYRIVDYIPTDFGSGISIPIAPSPATAPLFAMAAATLSLRHRPRMAAR